MSGRPPALFRDYQALIDKAVAERCAPLVEALEWIEKRSDYPPSFLSAKARDALAAYHAAQGAGRGTITCAACGSTKTYWDPALGWSCGECGRSDGDE